MNNYFECFSGDVRIHVSRTHAACLVRFITNCTLERALISAEIKTNIIIDQNRISALAMLTYVIVCEW